MIQKEKINQAIKLIREYIELYNGDIDFLNNNSSIHEDVKKILIAQDIVTIGELNKIMEVLL